MRAHGRKRGFPSAGNHEALAGGAGRSRDLSRRYGNFACGLLPARELRDQCLDQDVAFFFKQWGGLHPKSGGRLLDGETWNDYPRVNLPLAASAASFAKRSALKRFV